MWNCFAGLGLQVFSLHEIRENCTLLFYCPLLFHHNISKHFIAVKILKWNSWNSRWINFENTQHSLKIRLNLPGAFLRSRTVIHLLWGHLLYQATSGSLFPRAHYCCAVITPQAPCLAHRSPAGNVSKSSPIRLQQVSSSRCSSRFPGWLRHSSFQQLSNSFHQVSRIPIISPAGLQ